MVFLPHPSTELSPFLEQLPAKLWLRPQHGSWEAFLPRGMKPLPLRAAGTSNLQCRLGGLTPALILILLTGITRRSLPAPRASHSPVCPDVVSARLGASSWFPMAAEDIHSQANPDFWLASSVYFLEEEKLSKSSALSTKRSAVSVKRALQGW